MTRSVLPAGVSLATLALILPVLVHAVDVWSTNEDLHFAFLLVPTAVGLIWRARNNLSLPAADAASRASMVLVLLGVAMFLVCERVSARTPAACAAGFLVWSEVCFLWGWRSAWRLAFPIGLVTYALALQPTLVSPLAFSLQGITAMWSATASQLIGVPVVREGLVLRSDTFAFVVAEACSGMNSLLALLALAGVWAYMVRGSAVARIAVIASVLPLVVVTNTTRVVAVMLIAQGFGEDAALGFFHTASSILLFSMALLGMLYVSRMSGCRILVTA